MPSDSMEVETGSVKTLPPAASFIPLDGRRQIRPNHARHFRHNYPSNHYNPTKRKRDSSSGSNNGGGAAVPSAVRGSSPGIVNLPPWNDPAYPYSKGIIGYVHLYCYRFLVVTRVSQKNTPDSQNSRVFLIYTSDDKEGKIIENIDFKSRNRTFLWENPV